MQRAQYSALAIAAVGGWACAQPWQAVVLHPPGAQESRVVAVQAGMQYGTCTLGSTGNPQAGYWRGSAQSWTPLADPTQQSYTVGADGAQQVGIFNAHASLWRGTPDSRVDLDPGPASGSISSVAGDVRGAVQVGTIGLLFDLHHAGLWHGTAGSFVDLHPPGAVDSRALKTDGVLQGGAVAWTGSSFHAAIWNGMPGSVVDVNPAGASVSWVRGMAPGLQVGYADFSWGTSAALWRGTAESFVNMNPPGMTTALFYATTGRVHAGILPQGSLGRAAVNFGIPDSWVGLHQFLPPQYASFSTAYAVYQDGPTVYVGGSARNSSQYDEAILWIGTDPCYANCDQSTATPLLNISDFSCFLNRFASGDPYANCDGSATAPVLNILDFACFLNKFAAGCS
jgi:hypothetical protein